VKNEIREDPVEEAPPLLSSWNHWYALVLGFLVFLVIVFYLFSKFYES